MLALLLFPQGGWVANEFLELRVLFRQFFRRKGLSALSGGEREITLGGLDDILGQLFVALDLIANVHPQRMVVQVSVKLVVHRLSDEIGRICPQFLNLGAWVGAMC